MDLQLFNEGNIELVIDLKTGESFATQAGYVRMSKKSQSTISSRMLRLSESQRKKDLKEAEVVTAKGLQKSTLITGKLVKNGYYRIILN